MTRGSAKHRLRWTLTLAFAALLVFGVACGDDDDKDGEVPGEAPATASPSAIAAAQLPACTAANQISLLQPATPTPTPAATATPTAAATPAAGATPTPTPRSAPSVDRVGPLPDGYQESFRLLYIYDRADNRQVRVICGNDAAAKIRADQPYEFGSVLVMETYRAKVDAQGTVMEDANGRFIREALTGIFVMRKEEGFGADYGALQTGNWEYVAFRPDAKTYLTEPKNTAACAACHAALKVLPTSDFVFRTNLAVAPDKATAGKAFEIGANEIQASSMLFGPNAFTVKAGTTVTWVNRDAFPHTVTSTDAGGFDSGIMQANARFTHTFNTAGTFQYVCTLHPEQMRARVTVTD